MKNICQLISHDKKKKSITGFPWWLSVHLDTDNANPDTGLIPDPGRIHMPWDT